MARASKTFRIFVSSTFSDLKEERNALQQRVFPRLRELCAQHGARFQAIDLRWGVSEEAGLDQRTVNICFDEIERCRKTTPRPNFILLLGDRYGWRPLPPQIPEHEFEEICRRISAAEQERLREWYRNDDNAVPPEYRLKPRKPGGEYEDYDAWSEVEAELRSILLNAVRDMPLEEHDRVKYEASATEQEIHRGALRVPGAREHVYCFFRTIRGLPQEESAKDFLDLVKKNGRWTPDTDASARLKGLKDTLRGLFPDNIREYETDWAGGGITGTHLDRLCEDVHAALSRVITEQLDRLEEVDPLDKEIADHDAFGEDRARVFIGRATILQRIADHLGSADPHPLTVHGASGSGKSALMARAVQQAQKEHPHAEVVVRFIGVTPESSDGRAMLQSLCLQISRRYGADESSVPTDYRELVDELPKRLALATAERPLIVFLDALDQLSDAEGARSLVWLPTEPPEHVRLVVSTLPGECLSALENKLPGSSLVALEPMPLEEGEELLDLWLKEAGRALQPGQRQEVSTKFERSNPQPKPGEPAGLPLYLKLAFEEARLWNSYTPSEQTVLSPDIPSIIRQLFGRLSDEANHGQLMVSRSLAYLAAAKNGLSEDEVLDVLSNDADVLADFKRRSPKSPDVDRLPVVIWSRLYFDLEPYLTERSADGGALLAFYHRQLGEVTADDYLKGDAKLPRHRLLAEYFAGAPLEIERADGALPNLRKLSELPYQQTMGELWEPLHDTLTDFRFLETKAAVGPIATTDSQGNKTTTYSGPSLLQEDFRLALEKFPLS